jgi:amino acid transporter
MRLNADLLISLFTATFAGVVFLVTRDLSRYGAVFVDSVLCAVAVLSLMVFIKGLLKPERIAFFESVIERNNILTGLIILLIYLVLIPFLGFLAASYLFYFTFNLYLAEGERFKTSNILQSLVICIVVVTSFYVIFHQFLGVPFPESSLLQSDP